jgi:hypothetical protein
MQKIEREKAKKIQLEQRTRLLEEQKANMPPLLESPQILS